MNYRLPLHLAPAWYRACWTSSQEGRRGPRTSGQEGRRGPRTSSQEGRRGTAAAGHMLEAQGQEGEGRQTGQQKLTINVSQARNEEKYEVATGKETTQNEEIYNRLDKEITNEIDERHDRSEKKKYPQNTDDKEFSSAEVNKDTESTLEEDGSQDPEVSERARLVKVVHEEEEEGRRPEWGGRIREDRMVQGFAEQNWNQCIQDVWKSLAS